MPEISAAAVRELRDRTDMPMMKCKAALEKSGGDMEKAMQYLREEGGKFLGSDKGARETAEGRIGVFADPIAKVAAIVEIRCETPSVVKNDRFVALSQELAQTAATGNPADVDALMALPSPVEPGRTAQDRLADVVGLIRENMRVARFVRVEGLAGGYVHHDGSLGVMLHVAGDTAHPELLRDICAHVAALSPRFAKATEIPPQTRDAEMEIAKKQAAEQAADKPANVIEKIAEGKYKTWLKENVLVEQEIANQMKYGKKTVGQLLQDAKLDVIAFYRFKVGEKS